MASTPKGALEGFRKDHCGMVSKMWCIEIEKINSKLCWHLPWFPCLQLMAVGLVYQSSPVHWPTLLSIRYELGQFHFVLMYLHHDQGLCHRLDHNPSKLMD